MTKRKSKSRSGPTIPESERRARGQYLLRSRVSQSIHDAYEREAAARGVSLGALVRERLESAEWAREKSE